VLKGYLAFALGALGDIKAIPWLQSALADEKSVETLRWTIVALGLLQDSTLRGRLESLYNQDEEQSTRAAALYGMGLTGGRDSIAFLTQVATQSKETTFVRAYAVYALGMACDTQSEPVPSVYARQHNYTLDLAFIQDLYYLF
jgi:HEAT repeat protein